MRNYFQKFKITVSRTWRRLDCKKKIFSEKTKIENVDMDCPQTEVGGQHFPCPVIASFLSGCSGKSFSMTVRCPDFRKNLSVVYPAGQGRDRLVRAFTVLVRRPLSADPNAEIVRKRVFIRNITVLKGNFYLNLESVSPIKFRQLVKNDRFWVQIRSNQWSSGENIQNV